MPRSICGSDANAGTGSAGHLSSHRLRREGHEPPSHFRSRRKTPKTGMTTAASEKADKRLAAGRVRSWLGSRLDPALAVHDDFDLVPAHEHRRSGQWIFAKDGKIWIGNSNPQDFNKWMRK